MMMNYIVFIAVVKQIDTIIHKQSYNERQVIVSKRKRKIQVRVDESICILTQWKRVLLDSYYLYMESIHLVITNSIFIHRKDTT